MVFISGFVFAQEDETPFSIQPDEWEAAEPEPLEDSDLSDLPNSPEEVQPLTDDEEDAVQKAVEEALLEEAKEDANPENTEGDINDDPFLDQIEQEPESESEPPMLPEGISEQEAQWANWADWDNVGVKNANSENAPRQELIAPQTEEDAVVDQSHAMEESSVPEFNENLDAAKRRISAEPESADPFENGSADDSEFDQQETVSDLVDNSESELQSSSPQKTRYLESYAMRQDKPAKINNRISNVVEKIKVVRRLYFDKQLNTADNSPFEAMMTVCAFGCYTSIYYSPQKENFNTAGALCWNYPMCETSILAINPNPIAAKELAVFPSRSGKKTFMARYPHGRLATVPINSSGTVFPYIGYCQQERSGEFLSMLAIARVSVDYEFTPRMPMDIDVLIANEDLSNAPAPVHTSGLTFTVADLVSDAMANCRGGDMSALLTCLSYYVPRENWKNAWGEEWSVLRILDYELKRTVNMSDSDSTDRLYGLTYALRHRLAFDDRRLELQYAIVDEYLERMKDFALSIQNEDGSFNGAFFTRKGKSRNPDDDFAATAHFARWLTILYHSSDLDDLRLTKMIEFLVTELEQRLDSWNPSEMSQKDVRAIAYALQAIAIYQQRWASKNN